MFAYDYHIHTRLSPCADRHFNIDKIIQIQQSRGKEEIGITDHDFSYGSRTKNIDRARKSIDECEPSISVRLGAESHMLEYRAPSIDIRFAACFDYILMGAKSLSSSRGGASGTSAGSEEGSRARVVHV